MQNRALKDPAKMTECNPKLRAKRANHFPQRLAFGYFTFEFFRKSEYGNVLWLGSPQVLSWFAAVPYLFWTVFLSRGLSRYFVMMDRSPVGVFAFRQKSDALYVGSVAVAPNYRGRGIGSFILCFAEEIARKAGKRWLELTVMKVNTPAQKLYVRFGFTLKEEKRYSFVLKKKIE
jgi:ribosomal protein S18 acetylase RimI-like enzyme